MSFKRLSTKTRELLPVLIPMFVLLLFVGSLFAQETTGALQGTVKDPSGAVVSNAQVVATSNILVGNKTTNTDASGYYRFANLPPGSYVITVTAKGFRTSKREGLIIEVGHLPTVDITLEVGGTDTVVEVSGATPAIDVTQNTTQTNITEDVVQDVPHGRSFQSVIQFAPSARNEPLAGNTVQSNGTGGCSAGSCSNGGDHGFSVAGGADSENSYLVEGQETANIIGGYSHTNVPFDFIQEVQVKSSGIEAEHGGALGGVVNVIMRKGSNAYHGSLFTQFENQALDGSPVAYSRYDPSSSGTPEPSWGGNLDPTYQNYQPVRPKTSDVFPGFTFGGPILKDRIFGFVGFNPEFNDEERKVNYGPTNGGIVPFSRNTQTYYTTARIDASLSQKVRVFGSWLYQLQRQSGQQLPDSDSSTGFFNLNTGCYGSAATPCISNGVPAFALSHALGYVAPNITTSVGADFTITPRLVATTRFGYYFENYHDFGYPTTGTIYNFQSNGIGAFDTSGKPLPSGPLQQSAGYFNIANNSNYTVRNANKAIQLDQDLAWFKSGWMGTHNFKFGYQLNRLSNDLDQHFNTPYIQVLPGNAITYNFQNPAVGGVNCAAVEAVTGFAGCVGTYGNLDVYDYGSLGKATSFNHGLFVQDAWTIGRGVTINAGVRFEHEYLPAENQPSGSNSKPINFSWGDKIAPRIGAAWDVFKDGRMKVFGSYGQFYDQMKLNLAISSFGGQYWQECWYAMMSPNLTSFNPAFNSSGRFCPGPTSGVQANWSGGTTPAGLTFLEGQNIRAFPTTCSTCSTTEEGVAPGLKPYEQHESVFGVDYQLRKNLAFEARWDRRRLDHVIEDSAIFNPNVGETFVIVNPGQGTNKTFSSFYDFLYPKAPLVCNATNPCPPNSVIPAARSYDGVEFRLTKTHSEHWFGMFSYTYSKLRGNYTGLTSTDVADGLGGRNAPNNSRSFDEPFFSWNAQGGSSSGLLPTDRPNAFKGYAYYELGWMKKFTTDFGIFQYAYSGTPLTSYEDVGFGFQPPSGAFPTDVVDRGKWVSVTQDPNTGAITFGPVVTKRTPWYTQTDFNLQQNYKISEQKVVSFSATFANLLNQRAVVSSNQQIDSNNFQSFLAPAGQTLFSGPAFYAAAQAPYNFQALSNAAITNPLGKALTVNSQYGTPYLYQIARTIRLGVKFTF